MNNSRSQTKIRKTQQVNLIAEQRYLKQKGLLTENIDVFMECFDTFGLTIDQIPQSCMSVTNKEEFLNCRKEINLAIMRMNKSNELTPLLTCLETKAQNLGLFIEPLNIEEPPSEEEGEETPEEGK
jgi:hypothetical protein